MSMNHELRAGSSGAVIALLGAAVDAAQGPWWQFSSVSNRPITVSGSPLS